MSNRPLPPNALADMLYAQDSIKEEIRTNPKYVHVSTVVRWCQREYALALRHLRHGVREFQPSGSDRIVWKIGRAVETHVRDSIIAAYGANRCFGRWRCQCKKSYVEGLGGGGMLSICCGSTYSTYTEYVVENDTYLLTGSIDLILLVDGALLPVEIKSITDSASANKTGKGFSTLKGPMGDHALQVSLYQVLLKDEGLRYPIADYCAVVYARKEYLFANPYKEFRLDMTEGTTWDTVAKSIRATVLPVFDTSRLPERLCASDSATRAKKCGHVQACFSCQ